MKDKEHIEIVGDNHISSNVETPLREDAFLKSDDAKIESIQHYFSKIMEELGLDLTDDSLSGTPYRFAKMYIKELFYGLNPKNKPKLSTFENKYGYKKMLVEQYINIDSACEHHFLPIVGHAHVAYIPKNKVIGLSKINRLVDYYARRPQVQAFLQSILMGQSGPHKGSNGAPMGGNGGLYFRGLWVLIIPKWLIKVPGHIAILVG